MSNIDETLKERGSRYGSFTGHAKITQDLKRAMQNTPKWNGLSDDKKECLEMVAHKIGRILNGDPEYIDNWHDILGYVKLVEDVLTAAALANEGNLVKHARVELAMLPDGDDPMNKMMNDHLIKMVQTFSDEGHSGMSAGYSVQMLQKLLRFEPIKPLTGEDGEWNEIAEGKFQNKRCSHVFKDADRYDGRAYDIDAVVFESPDGSRYTGKGSAEPITFPYTPTTKIVKVDQHGRAL